MGSYSAKVIEHFQNPHNYGKIDNADGVGEVGNVKCGDVMHLYIKVKDNVIKDIKYETFGCVAAIATSSVVTDLAKGKKISEILKMTNHSILKELGGLPPIKVHCSLLAVDALNEAIYDYYQKIKKPIPQALEEKHKMILKQHSHK
ncbi:iron-sulfur cluster assembly scaffold protein [Patescibacteria group bacterium]|nr:iron-sulfur cluster assembly scaffold protein [Patescibacteria group bacterium]